MKKILIFLLCTMLLFMGCVIAKNDTISTPIATEIPAATDIKPQETANSLPSSTALPNRVDGSGDTSAYSAFIDDCYKYDTYEISLILEASMGMDDSLAYEISFLLPKGWYCLDQALARELYLGATEGRKAQLFDSRLWFYDDNDMCMGAIGIKRSNIAAGWIESSASGIQAFYSAVNSDQLYRFVTDEYYFPVAQSTLQFTDRFAVSAITEVLYTREYLSSFGINSESDRLNMGILSRRPEDNVYVCIEFFGAELDIMSLSDIARSISWGGTKAAD